MAPQAPAPEIKRRRINNSHGVIGQRSAVVILRRAAEQKRPLSPLPRGGEGMKSGGCVARMLKNGASWTLSPTGFLTIDGAELEYRMIGPSPGGGADHRDAA